LELATEPRSPPVRSILSRARARVSFANVTSTLALFVALGGTSYAAIALPADSVGKAQIRAAAVGKSEVGANSIGASELRTGGTGAKEILTNAVGASEVRPSAIDSDELADRGIGAVDLSDAAKTALSDIAGVTFRAASTGAGVAAGGNAKTITRNAAGDYTIELTKDVGACQYSATLAGAKTGTTIEPPVKGFITAEPSTDNTKVLVKTFDATGAAADSPFHLLIAC
jgi:hypothetical protein